MPRKINTCLNICPIGCYVCLLCPMLLVFRVSLLMVPRVSPAGSSPSVPCWKFPECPLLVVFRVSLLVVSSLSPLWFLACPLCGFRLVPSVVSGPSLLWFPACPLCGFSCPLGPLLGLIFSHSLLVRPGKRPEGPPRSAGEGPGAEKSTQHSFLRAPTPPAP